MENNKYLLPISMWGFFALCLVLGLSGRMPFFRGLTPNVPALSVEHSSLIFDEHMDAEDFHMFVSTIWGEARSEGYRGMCAVAEVILNRYKDCKARNLQAVLLQNKQFSCWNRADPNLPKIKKLSPEDPGYALAKAAALAALRGTDYTKGATHYHAYYVKPDWAHGVRPLAHIGKHKFYTLA